MSGYILDPLTAAEIQQVVTLVQGASPIPIDGVIVIFASIELVEADKAKVLENIPQDRFARALIYQNPGNHTFEYIVDLTQNSLVVSNKELPHVIPPMNFSNGLANFPYFTAPNGYSGPYWRNALNEPNNKAAAEFRAGLAKRGISVDEVGTEPTVTYFIGFPGFEAFRKVKPNACQCNCDCNCPTKLVLNNAEKFKNGRYFLFNVGPVDSNAIGGVTDGLIGIIDVSLVNSFGTPGVVVAVTNPNVPSPAIPQVMFDEKKHGKYNTTCGREDCECKVGYHIFLSETATVDDTLNCSILNTHLDWTLHNLHVTRYNPEQMYGAGNAWIQAKKDVGLAEYVKNDQDIVNKDIVTWITMSIPHNPCAEDYPIIPPHVQKFRLTPANFFINNPVLGITAPNQTFFPTSC